MYYDKGVRLEYDTHNSSTSHLTFRKSENDKWSAFRNDYLHYGSSSNHTVSMSLSLCFVLHFTSISPEMNR